jgi:integrase
MRGRIIKRKGSKNYTIVLQMGLDPVTGKRKQQWIAVKGNKRDVEDKLTELLHDARHSHASLLLRQGVHPKIVQERLGHSSIQVTLDTYSHVAPGLQEAAAAGFDDIVRTREDVEIPTN